MLERLAGIWLGLTVVAAWTIVSIILGLVFVEPEQPLRNFMIVGLIWLVVAGPMGWSLWDAYRRR